MWNRFSGNGGSKTATRGLRAVDDLTTAVLATLSDHVAILDADGNVIAVNKAWKTYDCECGDRGLPRSDVGSNYLEACQAAEQAEAGGFEGAALGLRGVLEGSRPHFSLTYLCHSPSGQRWFQMTATPTGSPADGAVISHAAVGKPPPIGEAPSITAIPPAETGEPLLRVLTENLAMTIGTRFAFLAEVIDQRAGRVRLVALWSGEGFEESFEYDVAGTPCQGVIRGDLCRYPADVQESFPDDSWLKEIAAECYLAVPLFGSTGEVIGHVGVIHDQSLDDMSTAEHVVRAVGAQASSELERLRLVRTLQKSERTARALLNAPVDSAILLEPDGTITDLNEVAAVRLGTTVDEAVGSNAFDLFPPELAATRRAAVDKVVTSRKPLRMEDERAGMHFETSIYPVLDPQGDVEGLAVFARNVTAQKVAEAELRQSEEKIRSLVGTITHGVEEVDLSGVITFANAALHRQLECSEGEVVGRSILDFVGSDSERETVRHLLQIQAKEHLSPSPYFGQKRTKSGKVIDVEVAWDYKRDEQGQISGFASVITDITERRRAEGALRESEEKFRLLAENVAEVFWLIDPKDYRVLYVSPAYEELWGRTCDSLYEDPTSWLAAVHPEDVKRVSAAVDEQVVTGKFEEEFRIVRSDGSIRWVWDRGFRVEDERGELQRSVGIATDITERKLAEEEFTLQARMLESMAEGVNVCDESEEILVTNPTFDKMFGYERGELINQHASVLNADPPEENARILEEVQKQLEQTGSWRGEFNNIRKDGTLFTTSARISALEVSGKTYLISVQEDITERKQAAEALRQSAERNAALIDAIPDMMFTLSRQGVYLDFVPGDGLEPYTPVDQFLGKAVSEVLPATLAQDVMRGVELALKTGSQQQLAYHLDLDDERREYEARIIKSKEDEALAIVRDVTALRRLEREEQLRRDRDELEGTVEKEMLGKNPYGLTFREFTVLHLAADGEADKAIADQLGISTFTVSKHVANILGKMAAASRTEACVRALREGLLT